VSEQILNGTSAQLGYTVPFTLVYSGKYTVFRKKTPTHIFFHISMNDVWI